MKAEIARHIVENGGLLAKDSVIHLLDCIESADRKIDQLIADRQQAISELAAAQRERDEAVLLRLEVSGALSSATVRYEQAEAELKRRDAQEPAAVPEKVVKLPEAYTVDSVYGEVHYDYNENGDNYDTDSIHEALTAAGVKYEVKS